MLLSASPLPSARSDHSVRSDGLPELGSADDIMSLLAREVTHDEDQKGGNKKMKRDDARRRATAPAGAHHRA